MIYSQALRIRKRCSDDRKFENHLLRQWYSSDKYPETLVEGLIETFRAKVASNDPMSEDSSFRDSRGIQFIIANHATQNCLHGF